MMAGRIDQKLRALAAVPDPRSAPSVQVKQLRILCNSSFRKSGAFPGLCWYLRLWYTSPMHIKIINL